MTERSAAPIKKFLNERMIGSLVAYHRDALIINEKTTIDEALNILKTHNFLSVPVVDSSNGEFRGILHLFDILLYVAFGYFKHDQDPSLTAEELKGKGVNYPAINLVGLAQEGKCGWWHDGLMVYEPTTSVMKVLDPMSGGVQRVLVRRMPTVGQEGQEGAFVLHESTAVGHALLTQTDLVRFLLEHVAQWRDMSQRTLADLGLDKPHEDGQAVCTVTKGTTALQAVRKLYTSGGDAVALLDDSGAISATLSASDLRGLTWDTMSKLNQPVEKFLLEQHGGQIRNPVTVTKDVSLEMCFTRTFVARVHRAWLVDASGRPQAVVRYSDMLRCILRHGWEID